MITQDDILERVASEPAPILDKLLAEKMGVKRDQISSQLSKLVKKELLQKSDDGVSATDAGREYLAGKGAEGGDGDGEDDEDDDDGDLKTPENLGVTPYQVFRKLGSQIGIDNKGKLRVAVDHIWRGGNWRDPEWVRAGLAQMGIREDLIEPWVNAWMSYLSSTTQRSSVAAATAEKGAEGDGGQGGPVSAAAPAAGSGNRNGFDYNLDGEDKPIYVGPGLGDMKYKDATDLAKIRAARSSSKSNGGGDDVVLRTIDALQKLGVVGGGCGGPPPKTIVVSTDEDGNARVEDVTNMEGGPTVVTAPKAGSGPKKKHTFIHADGKVEQIEEGQPVIIHVGQPAAAAGAGDGKLKLIDKATGKIEEYPAGTPIIIQQPAPIAAAPAPAGSQTVIQMKDKDGNPITFDIDTYFRMESWKADERRKEENFQTGKELKGSVIDLVKKGVKALENMGEGKGA
jgi:DNA-binding MarR family transcriptional regulator